MYVLEVSSSTGQYETRWTVRSGSPMKQGGRHLELCIIRSIRAFWPYCFGRLECVPCEGQEIMIKSYWGTSAEHRREIPDLSDAGVSSCGATAPYREGGSKGELARI